MDFAEKIAERNRNNPFARYVGVETMEMTAGQAVDRLVIRPEHLNSMGAVQGGCLYTLADLASGAAAVSTGCKVVTASGEYHYLAAAKDVREVTARATVVKRGRTLVICDVELHTETGLRIGKATFTHCVIAEDA